jgi:hypothetical protein
VLDLSLIGEFPEQDQARFLAILQAYIVRELELDELLPMEKKDGRYLVS